VTNLGVLRKEASPDRPARRQAATRSECTTDDRNYSPGSSSVLVSLS
jgi:hypothetical protein